MDYTCGQFFLFVVVLAVTHTTVISVAIDTEGTIKQGNEFVEKSVAIDTEGTIKQGNEFVEKSKDGILLDRINVLENQVASLLQENQKIIELLSERRIDSHSVDTQERQPDEPQNILTTNENIQTAAKNEEEIINENASSIGSGRDTTQQKPVGLLRRRRAAVVGGIAFSAYLTNTNEHMVPGQALKFNCVLVNDGDGYNQYTGAFTAPVTGTYLFTYHFDTTKLTFVRLVLNGINQNDAVANPHTGVGSNRRLAQSMGGNSAILHVPKGQAVLVETFEINVSAIDSSDNFRLSTFSGVLLY